MTWVFIIHIFATVPFVGHVTNDRLFCNAACEVVETGYRTDGPVNITYPGHNLTVRAL